MAEMFRSLKNRIFRKRKVREQQVSDEVEAKEAEHFGIMHMPMSAGLFEDEEDDLVPRPPFSVYMYTVPDGEYCDISIDEHCTFFDVKNKLILEVSGADSLNSILESEHFHRLSEAIALPKVYRDMIMSFCYVDKALLPPFETQRLMCYEKQRTSEIRLHLLIRLQEDGALIGSKLINDHGKTLSECFRSTWTRFQLLRDNYSTNMELAKQFRSLKTKNVAVEQCVDMRSSGDVVQIFKMVEDNGVCQGLINEVKKCSTDCELAMGQIPLDVVALKAVIKTFITDCILPALSLNKKYSFKSGCIFYESSSSRINEDMFGFVFTPNPTVWSRKSSVRSLVEHRDDSDYTVNLCLGGEFKSSSVVFDGDREIFHTQLQGLAHGGHLRHSVKPIIDGERFNLLIFLDKI